MTSAGTVSSRPGIAVLVVDDHRIFADAIAMRLSMEPEVDDVRVASSVSAARAVVNGLDADVVLLDYNVGGACGLDLLPDLDRLPRRPRVLMLSASDDASNVVESLARGADGWVSKEADIRTLLRAASDVLADRMYLWPEALAPVVRLLLSEARPPEPTSSFLDALSARELEVLRCLVSGMTRADVSERLFISVNTVRTHVQRLLKRAGVHSTLALVVEARQLGVSGIDDAPQDVTGAGPVRRLSPT